MTVNRRGNEQLKKTLETTNLDSWKIQTRNRFLICEISTMIKSATIADIKAIKKVARFVTFLPNSIMFPRLDPKYTSVKMFVDASYNKLPNSGSQGGNIVFLSDKTNNLCALACSSRRVKRVARSTLAAESLAFSGTCETAYVISELPKEPNIINVNAKNQCSAYTDNQSFYHTTQRILCRTEGF